MVLFTNKLIYSKDMKMRNHKVGYFEYRNYTPLRQYWFKLMFIGYWYWKNKTIYLKLMNKYHSNITLVKSWIQFIVPKFSFIIHKHSSNTILSHIFTKCKLFHLLYQWCIKASKVYDQIFPWIYTIRSLMRVRLAQRR